MGQSYESGAAVVRARAAANCGLTWKGRVLAAALLAASAGVFALAAHLKPDSRGYGTHQQLGMGACGLLLRTGYPCPTCGMTTAFSFAVRGQLVRAFWAQPAGLLLAMANLAVAAGAAWTLITGRLPRFVERWDCAPHWLFWGLLLVLLGGWAFKLLFGLMDGSLPVRYPHV